MSTASSIHRQVDTRVVVETPEGVDFRFVIAGPGVRATAWLIDLLIKFGILAAISIGLTALGLFGQAGLFAAEGFLLVSMFLMDWLYGAAFESWMQGQTPGKRSVGLRVLRTNGTPVDVMSAFGRNFLRTADLLPFFYTFGLISMLMTRRLQRLGDVVFDTMVINEHRDWISRATGLGSGAEPLSRSECPRRYHVPERTLSVIERLFESDRIITDGRREEIARPLSEAIRKRLGYQDPPPDPRNPHAYFQGRGYRHTQFLLRVLKTFSDGPEAAFTAGADGNGSRRNASPMRSKHAETFQRNVGRTQDDPPEITRQGTGNLPPAAGIPGSGL